MICLVSRKWGARVRTILIHLISVVTGSEGRETLTTSVGSIEKGVDVVPWIRFPLMVLPKHHFIHQPLIATASLIMRCMYISM